MWDIIHTRWLYCGDHARITLHPIPPNAFLNKKLNTQRVTDFIPTNEFNAWIAYELLRQLCWNWNFWWFVRWEMCWMQLKAHWEHNFIPNRWGGRSFLRCFCWTADGHCWCRLGGRRRSKWKWEKEKVFGESATWFWESFSLKGLSMCWYCLQFLMRIRTPFRERYWSYWTFDYKRRQR